MAGKKRKRKKKEIICWPIFVQVLMISKFHYSIGLAASVAAPERRDMYTGETGELEQAGNAADPTRQPVIVRVYVSADQVCSKQISS